MRRIASPFLAIAFFIASLFGIQSASAAGYNWSGFYAGIHLGGVWGKSKATDLNGWNGSGDSFTASSNGFNGGVQAGYNWQIPSSGILFGIEGDLGYLGFKGSAMSALAQTQASGTTVSSSGSLYGTVRGRFGVTWDQVLLYGTGGLMVANAKSQVSDNIFVTPIQTSSTGTQAGWTIGGGLEFGLTGAMSGWTMKGEYLYFDLGTKTVTGTNTVGTFNWDIRNTGSIGRFGLNRRF